MKSGSLRLRLFLTAVISVSIALVLAGFLLIELFDRHVSRRVDAELSSYLRQLAGVVEFMPDGRFALARELPDTRFGEPFSGFYWQIEDDKSGRVLGSRSLWDARIPLPHDALDVGTIHHHRLPGPEGTTLRVQERSVVFELPSGNHALRMAVAIDNGQIEAARAAFAAELWPSIAVLGLILLAATWFQISIGLKPLEAIRRGVQEVRSGASTRLSDRFPSEVTPLIEEVNTLLAAQEETLSKARARATDLAHGLKTPLTVLQSDAERLRRRGNADIADELGQLATHMRQHVERELARVRVRGVEEASQSATSVRAIAERLADTLRRTPRGETLIWQIDIPADLKVAADSQDLIELLGNMLDNASKWARSTVTVEGRAEGETAQIRITDDGIGVPEEALPSLAERGVRLDAATPGTGIGLAIARDIVTACRGDMQVANNERGGLSVTLHLPLSKAKSS